MARKPGVDLKRGAIIALLALACIAFFAASLSRHLYEVTSPGDIAHHVALRKFYSIIAFTVVGTLLSVILPLPSLRRSVIGVALFSTLIEIAQKLHGSTESLTSNLFDIGCGAVGGFSGYFIARWILGLRPKA